MDTGRFSPVSASNGILVTCVSLGIEYKYQVSLQTQLVLLIPDKIIKSLEYMMIIMVFNL